MDDPEYFGMDAISNSQLGLLIEETGGGPQKFLQGFKNEANYNASLNLGSSVHQLLLERDKYFLSDYEKPGGKVGLIMESVYKMISRENAVELDEAIKTACIYWDYYTGSLTEKRLNTLKETGLPYLEYLKEFHKDGMIVLTEEMKSKCFKCVESIRNNSFAKGLLYPEDPNVLSFNEDVLVCDAAAEFLDDFIEPEFKVKLKAKLDNWSVNLTTNEVVLNDLKTTGKNYFIL